MNKGSGFLFLLVLGALLFSAVYTAPIIIDYFNAVHRPANECEKMESEEKYCRRQSFDDGYVRFSVAATGQKNCCIIERFVITEKKLDYKMLACDPNNKMVINCGSFQGSISGGLRDRWLIDGRETAIDMEWDKHFSRYVMERK